MPKRKKFPRLPSGYGEIRYLGKGRRNCYAVHPPCNGRDRNEQGRYIRPKAICYVDDWYVGFAVLSAYHAGTYKPGDELQFKQYRALSDANLDDFCKRLLTDHIADRRVEIVKKEKEPTFAEVYDMFYEWKYGEHAAKKLSKQSQDSTRAAFGNCKQLHDRVFRDIRVNDLQKCLDECTLKKASLENIASLLKQIYKFAEPRELCDKNYAQYIILPDAEEDEHGVPLSDDDLAILWKHTDNPTVAMILIMCYSGYRIAAYPKLIVNMDEWYFKGGVKTKTGKDRVVPIHSAIRPLVAAKMEQNGYLLGRSTTAFRDHVYPTLSLLNIEKHTPHDFRHTFSRLCEKYGVSDADRKRMMGHSFGADITNGIYGHRTLEELRVEIEKIQTPQNCGDSVGSNPD